MSTMQTLGPAAAFASDLPLIWTRSQPPEGGPAVAVVDGDKLGRECLGRALELACPGGAVLAYGSAEDFLAGRHAAGLVLYALREEAHASALRAIGRLRAADPAASLVVLLDVDAEHEPAAIRNLIAAGASSVIATRRAGIEAALALFALVQAGATFVPPEAPGPCDPDPAAADGTRLTRREKAVLALLDHGQANKLIAYRLGMSESTVKIHIRNILRKMGATNRTQAVYQARKLWSADEIARQASL
jgi:DNA-binding NarL/FixJ family response regulator